MQTPYRTHRFWLWPVIILCFVAAARAQDTVTGAFEGTVTDSQTGEPIANAAVTIINQATNIIRAKTANAQGRFYQGLLAPGVYTIRVAAPGYATREVEQRLNVSRTGEVVPVPVSLDPAPPTPPATATPTPTPLTAQQTQVRAETNRSDAQRSGSFPDGTVDALPLGGTTITRSFDELTTFLPGVTLPPPTLGNGAGPGQGPGVGSAGQFSFNGLRSRANNFTVDGSDNNDEDIGVRRQGFLSLVPQSVESIREYQATTLLPNAVFGRNLGGQINAVSRSGGNQFHGALYGFFNSEKLNARNFFDSANGNAVTPLQVGNQPVIVAPAVNFDNATRQFAAVNGSPLTVRNGSGGEDSFTFAQSGFTVGGPLKKERAFFFLSLERQIVNAVREANFAVPTVAQRGIGNSGATGLFRNPFNGLSRRNLPTTTPGDEIFSLYPFPNNPTGVYGANTFTQTLPADARGTIASAKFDQNFRLRGREQTLTERYNFTQDRRVLPVTGGALFSMLEPRVRAQNLSLFLNSELSGNVFNQLRLSYGRTRLVFDALPDRTFLRPSAIFPNDPFLLNAPRLENRTLPRVADASGDTSLPNAGPVIFLRSGATAEGAPPCQTPAPGSPLQCDLGPVGQVRIAGFSPVGYDVFNFPQRRVNNTYQLADNLTIRSGNSTLVFGYDGRRSELNSDLPRNSRPLVTFGGAPQIVAQLNAAGQLVASFNGNLMSPLDLAAAGAPGGFTQSLNNGTDAGLNLRFYQHNLFAQNDWRLRPNLSLSFGVRYEFNTPVSESSGRVESSFSDPALSLVPGLTQFIADRTRVYEPDYNNLAPRVAIAYAWRPDTVFRAGYGLYFDQILGAVVSQSRNVYPRFLNVNAAGGLGNPFAVTCFSSLTVSPCQPLGLLNPLFNSVLVQPGTLNRLAIGVPLATQVQQLNLIASAGNLAGAASGVEATLPARNLDMPLAHQFSFGVERQFTSNFALSAAYVGTQGRQLLRFTTPNLGSNAVLTTFGFSTAQSNQNLNFAPQLFGLALPPGSFFGAGGVLQGGRPVPSVGGVSVFTTTGVSKYNSLQLQARGNLVARLRFQAAYTLSQTLDDVSDVFDLAGASVLPQNSLNPQGEFASANFDARHRFAYYFVYDLAPDADGLWLRDWQLSGTGQIQSGTPFTVNSVFDVNLDGNLTDRLNTLQGLVLTGDRRQPLRLAADPRTLLAAFGQDGAIPRNSFRTGNLLDLNLALSKGLRLTETQRFLLRVEIFNFINRANFGVPVRLLEAPGFGAATDTLTPGRRVQFVIKYLF